MDKIYFVNEQHEQNFNITKKKFPQSARDKEYQSTCYILSTPIIFETIESHMDDFETPVDWIWRYLTWLDGYKDEWDNYSSDNLHPDHEAWIDNRPYDLTGSMVQLGRLSLNLWTSYDDFNLMRCLSSLDTDNIHVFKSAIDIRLGLY